MLIGILSFKGSYINGGKSTLDKKMVTIFLLIIITNLVLIRNSLLIVSVKGKSMEPTLRPDDLVLVFRYLPKKFLRKNNVVLISQNEKFDGKRNELSHCIKRIVGLPGELMLSEVEVDLCIDKHQLNNKSDILIVPEKHFFVQGDNYEKSIDSRHWGPIPFSRILGVVVKKIN